MDPANPHEQRRRGPSAEEAPWSPPRAPYAVAASQSWWFFQAVAQFAVASSMLDSPIRAPGQDFHLRSQHPCQAHPSSATPPRSSGPVAAASTAAPAPFVLVSNREGPTSTSTPGDRRPESRAPFGWERPPARRRSKRRRERLPAFPVRKRELGIEQPSPNEAAERFLGSAGQLFGNVSQTDKLA
jgi:hypothetical protein